jgi:hypothetical protein
METVHGVDVSWQHKPNRDRDVTGQDAPSTPSTPSRPDADQARHEAHVHRAPGIANDAPPPVSSHSLSPSITSPPSPPLKSPTSPQQPAPPHFQSHSSTPSDSPNNPTKPASRRPSILSRSSSQKEAPSRRNSWISNISSKFSSQPLPSPSIPQTTKSQANGTNAGPSSQSARDNLVTSPSQPTFNREAEELQPYVPQKPKESANSFFSSITRRLSSNALGGNLRGIENGGMCARRVLNVNQGRERCLLPELDSSKLRRVAFSVDVEIASGPRYKDDDGNASRLKKVKEKKSKDRGEGDALKNPQAVTERKEQLDAAAAAAKSTEDAAAAAAANNVTSPETSPERATASEEASIPQPEDFARQERKEKKRQKAEDSGQLPRELTAVAPTHKVPSTIPTPYASGTSTPKDRPTTDPVRIYRRCCQLRESPILKRITEQLMAEDCTSPEDPGTVVQLNLTGSRLQLADFVTLSDWLAIVPVKRLLLEDADISDEGLRVVLAGLLASKKPEPTRRRNGTRQIPSKPTGGIVEKLILKNNPRISKIGWKHISIFLYMCRSIKALDVSMLHFPQDLPPVEAEDTTKPPIQMPKSTGNPFDAADTLCKALSGRLGGARLEEITMAECGLVPYQIRKIVDGATTCGIARLGFAGNKLDDEGFEHILHYVRSGVCHALDLGSNDLRGKLGKLAEALKHNPNCPVWGLGLAESNLDTNSLRELLPTLTTLPSFRFIDISHNRNLFEGDVSTLQLLRRYLPKLNELKRLHLVDVGLSVKQAISLAEVSHVCTESCHQIVANVTQVIPEGPSLAHLTILENPQLSALSQATDEDSQEEACALYASLCAAARVSKSLVCIDVDVSCTIMCISSTKQF